MSTNIHINNTDPKDTNAVLDVGIITYYEKNPTSRRGNLQTRTRKKKWQSLRPDKANVNNRAKCGALTFTIS